MSATTVWNVKIMTCVGIVLTRILRWNMPMIFRRLMGWKRCRSRGRSCCRERIWIRAGRVWWGGRMWACWRRRNGLWRWWKREWISWIAVWWMSRGRSGVMVRLWGRGWVSGRRFKVELRRCKVELKSFKAYLRFECFWARVDILILFLWINKCK